jgi:hypothetical protein
MGWGLLETKKKWGNQTKIEASLFCCYALVFLVFLVSGPMSGGWAWVLGLGTRPSPQAQPPGTGPETKKLKKL